ncbi:MAG: membrane protein insertase YidC [Pirellulales bacterium]|nr:membrane protein insertase YidC [Pirellulales bacterium]
MARKILTFVSLSMLILLCSIWMSQKVNRNAGNQVDREDAALNQQDGDKDSGEKDPHPLIAPPVSVPAVAPQRVTLGSLSPDSDYVMLVTANNRGGTIERIELNNPRFQDLIARRERQGYLGHLAPRDPMGSAGVEGVEVTAVGEGTPAQAAGVQVGDIVTSITPVNGESIPVASVLDWETLLNGEQARVGAQWTLEITDSSGNQVQRDVTLAAMPLSIVAPNTAPGSVFQDPLSMRLTLQSVRQLEGDNNNGDGEIPAASDLTRFLSGNGGITVGDLPTTHPMYVAGLRQGNLIKSVDGVEFTNLGELKNYLAQVPTGAWLRMNFEAEPRANFETGKSLRTALVRLPAEIPEMNLHDVTWNVKRPEGQDNVVEFEYTDPRWKLRYTKRFTLARKSELAEEHNNKDLPPGFHLTMDLEIENLGVKREVVYQIDGFNGLPDEGWWYSSKLARGWFEGIGARDVMFEFEGADPALIGASRIAKFDELPRAGGEVPLKSISSDSRYFASSLIPIRGEGENAALWFQRAQAVRVGAPRTAKESRLTNTSFRLLSIPVVLGREEKTISRSFRLFVGPKSTDLLAEPDYQLSELVYYGWPIWGVFAKVLQSVLHFIYGVIPNYGLAILILTVIVRGAMFPLSRKNALGAQKMQALQPEIRRLNEKYKNNPQEKMRATQELFRKHNYHPLGGCLILFLQLPIFIGLYRALMLDVELRQAPLIPGFTAWCDNLAAPDMLFYWGDWAFLPDFLVSNTGFLGPYFNILPIVTIGLFIMQQKMFMPPPMDDQQRMQQKLMKYMMVFFAFMFFKVPAGLCLYFIASSVWGIAERKFLPKPNKDQQTAITEADAGPSPRERRKMAASSGNGSPQKPDKKRNERKKKP